MLTRAMLDSLLCPVCAKGGLTPEGVPPGQDPLQDGSLICGACGEAFALEKGIPHLVPPAIMADPAWQTWRAHLDGFQARREQRVGEEDKLINQFSHASLSQQAFARFTGIDRGWLLDVGCGPGKFRHLFQGKLVAYVGVDPIPLPGYEAFSYVRGLGEHLPFADHRFDHAVVLNSLDHFQNPDPFFRELARILKPGGRFHLMQTIHDLWDIPSAIKWLAHVVKDAVEDLTTRHAGHNAPHHMTEFTRQILIRALERHFQVLRQEVYSSHWYSPNRLFLSLTPKS
ncbi:MAG: methyltransferase domain-containing protein [Magnetococcales bacterium]|nr:methyltransferase domain-containing protein [Magnetococcales bacterium]